MGNRVAITTAAMLDMLDDTDVMDGYTDGLQNEPEPGDNRSFSYWHGWRNGMVDGKHRPLDHAQQLLSHDVNKTGYLRGKFNARPAEDKHKAH